MNASALCLSLALAVLVLLVGPPAIRAQERSEQQELMNDVSANIAILEKQLYSSCAGSIPSMPTNKLVEGIGQAVEKMKAYKADRKRVITSGLGKIFITAVVGIIIGAVALASNVIMFFLLRRRVNQSL